MLSLFCFPFQELRGSSGALSQDPAGEERGSQGLSGNKAQVEEYGAGILSSLCCVTSGYCETPWNEELQGGEVPFPSPAPWFCSSGLSSQILAFFFCFVVALSLILGD